MFKSLNLDHPQGCFDMTWHDIIIHGMGLLSVSDHSLGCSYWYSHGSFLFLSHYPRQAGSTTDRSLGPSSAPVQGFEGGIFPACSICPEDGRVTNLMTRITTPLGTEGTCFGLQLSGDLGHISPEECVTFGDVIAACGCQSIVLTEAGTRNAPSAVGSETGSIISAPTISGVPSTIPSTSPSGSSLPSSIPSIVPSSSGMPSSVPSASPTASSIPSSVPSLTPTTSSIPSSTPSSVPSVSAVLLGGEPSERIDTTTLTTEKPVVVATTVRATAQPSKQLDEDAIETEMPSEGSLPSAEPSSVTTGINEPSQKSGLVATVSAVPSGKPSRDPTGSAMPSFAPTQTPTSSGIPSEKPSLAATDSVMPSFGPTQTPTSSGVPSEKPSRDPTGSAMPSFTPTQTPTSSGIPSEKPSSTATDSGLPSAQPSLTPSSGADRSRRATNGPTTSSSPSSTPSLEPSASSSPSSIPSSLPTTSNAPSLRETESPTEATALQEATDSSVPSGAPTDVPVANTISQQENLVSLAFLQEVRSTFIIKSDKVTLSDLVDDPAVAHTTTTAMKDLEKACETMIQAVIEDVFGVGIVEYKKNSLNTVQMSGVDCPADAGEGVRCVMIESAFGVVIKASGGEPEEVTNTLSTTLRHMVEEGDLQCELEKQNSNSDIEMVTGGACSK